MSSRETLLVDPEEGVADHYIDPDLHSISYEWDGPVPVWQVETGVGDGRRSIVGFTTAVETYEVVLRWSAAGDALPVLIAGLAAVKSRLIEPVTEEAVATDGK